MKHIIKNIHIWIMLLLAATACEKSVVFPSEQDGRILVDAMITDNGRSRINIAVTQPIGGNEKTTADKVRLRMTADGKDIRLILEESDYTGAMVSYYTDARLFPGQKIVLKGEAAGIPSIYAESSVPAMITEKDLTIKWLIDESSDCFTMTLSLNDETISDNDHIGIQVIKRTLYEYIGNIPEDIRKVYDETNGTEEIDDIIAERTLTQNSALSSEQKNPIIDFNGGRTVINNNFKDISIDIRRTYRKLVASEVNPALDIDYNIFKYHDYKIKVFRLSPELHNYLNSKYILTDLDAIHLGFSPTTYIYTNVKGGLGVFAGASIYESEWYGF